MKKPMFENEEEAKYFFIDIFKSELGIAPFMLNCKKKGYIKQNIIEEAEEAIEFIERDKEYNGVYQINGEPALKIIINGFKEIKKQLKDKE